MRKNIYRGHLCSCPCRTVSLMKTVRCLKQWRGVSPLTDLCGGGTSVSDTARDRGSVTTWYPSLDIARCRTLFTFHSRFFFLSHAAALSGTFSFLWHSFMTIFRLFLWTENEVCVIYIKTCLVFVGFFVLLKTQSISIVGGLLLFLIMCVSEQFYSCIIPCEE